MKTLIRNAKVLTMAGGPIETKDIGIENDHIKYVGNVPDSFEADYIVDGDGHLAMPGLINAHTHSSMSLLRNYADDLPFWEWLTEKVWPIEEKMGPEEVYWGTMLSNAEMIKSGITAYADMYFYSAETAKASVEAGLRCSIAQGLIGSSDKDQEKLNATRQLFKEWHKTGDGLITVMAGPHAPYTCDDAFLTKVIELCSELNIPIHTHLSESEKEVKDSLNKNGRSPIQHMAHLGLFKHHTLAAHCVHLLEEDVDVLRDQGVHVVHNPSSNLKLGNGISPVSKLLSSGVNVSIGTDGSSSNNNLNMFEEVHLAALLAKGSTRDPAVLPAFQALEMATKNGAAALNLGHETGTLEPGKKADLILVNLEQPHLYPHFQLDASMVYSAQASDVRTVMVNGKILMEKGELKTIDLEKTYHEIKRITKKLVG